MKTTNGIEIHVTKTGCEHIADRVIQEVVDSIHNGNHFLELGFLPEEQLIELSFTFKDNRVSAKGTLNGTHSTIDLRFAGEGWTSYWWNYSAPTSNSSKGYWQAWLLDQQIRDGRAMIDKAKLEIEQKEKLLAMFLAGKLFTNHDGIKPVVI